MADPEGRINLPAQTTTFVGRERELSDVEAAIDSARLVTLLGPGGSGKTRLAVEAATAIGGRFADGAWFVDLGPLGDPSLVAQATAAVTGVPDDPSKEPVEALVDGLRAKRALLVLDNCEHVLAGCTALADALLRSCPYVRLLSTSREQLRAIEERIIELPPLASTEAVRLFVERAVVARPSFRLTDDNAATVDRVCARLDGLPLAIELAAARIKVLSAEQIDERLAQRFELLTGGDRTRPPRQQTLRALVDWSYDLLSEPERMVLRRLSVFAGGADIEGAEAVCSGDGVARERVLDLLSDLVDRSLVGVEERGGRTRYRLLETIREYAAQKLEEAEDVAALRERHRRFYVDLSIAAAKPLGSYEAGWLARLEAEHDDIRVALRSGLDEGATEDVLEIASQAWRLWHNRGYLREGRRWLDEIIAAVPEPTAGRARILNVAANLAVEQEDLAAARPLHEEALAIRRALGDPRVITSLNDLGILHLREGRADDAVPLLEESLALAEDAGQEYALDAVTARVNLGAIAHAAGDWTLARTHYEATLGTWRELRGGFGAAATLGNLGDVLTHLGDYAAAHARLSEALTAFAELGDRLTILIVLESMAELARAEGKSDRAATLLGSTDAARTELGSPLPAFREPGMQELREAIRADLGDSGYDAAVEAGRAMSLDHAVAYAKGELAPDHDVGAGGNAFHLEGEYWTIAFGERAIRLRDAKGLRYLASLLTQPGREFHCAEFASTPDAGPVESDAGDILDPAAKRAYQERLEQLREEIAEAESWGDAGRASRAQDEIDAIAQQLASAFGLGGRARKGADTVERIRKAVTNRIKASQAKIAHEHPELGRHLANAVRTGVFCSYQPDRPIVWRT